MGCVYILVNQDMPGLIKIGRTNRTAVSRAKQLSEATGVPSPFEVAYVLRCKQYKELEKDIHGKLKKYRRPNREFFDYPVDDAILLFNRLASKYPDVEKESITGPTRRRSAPSKHITKIKKDWKIKKEKGNCYFLLHLPKGKELACVYNVECQTLRTVLDKERLFCMENSTDNTKKQIWDTAQVYREYFDSIYAGEIPKHKPPRILKVNIYYT